MKRINVFLLLVFSCMGLFPQANHDAFVGTWVYQNNDTIFRVKLQKATIISSISTYNAVLGNYSLMVKGVTNEDYMGTMPSVWDAHVSAPSCNIYIYAFGSTPNYLGFTFYDQCKQHLDGKGIPGGKMFLIASDKLHWTLNEEEGLWLMLEGSGEDMTPRGFSVPTDVIMTKEK